MPKSDELHQRFSVELLQNTATRFGTPFFLYDIDTFRSQVNLVKAAFEDRVSVYFAVKANPNLELLKAIKPFIDGLDVSSVGEYEQAKLAGYAPQDLSFAGPAKTAEELRPVIADHIGSISVESQRELKEIVSIAGEMRTRANVTIRVNPLQSSKAFGLKMGGRATQFGIDEEDLLSTARLVAGQQELVRFVGIHVYAGSQAFDYRLLSESIRDTVGICQNLERETNLRCAKVNFGGGFGVSHGESTKSVDLDALYDDIKSDFTTLADVGERKRELIFELGRFLVADAGIYVVRVISTKVSRDKHFVVVDGGLHHHLAAAGMFGVGIRTNYEVRNFSDPNAEVITCSLAGPSCNPTDLLAVNANLPKPKTNDLLGVMTSGSYAFTASPLLFLGRPTAAEVIHENGDIRLGRRSYDITDFN